MLILYHQTTKKPADKKREPVLNETHEQLSHLSGLPEGEDLNLENIRAQKKSNLGRQLLKRISPFLLLDFFLAGLFPYMMITGRGFTHNEWLLVFLFIFIEVNVLFIDFALWNYFEGKKIFRIWLMEIPLTFLIIHFLI